MMRCACWRRPRQEETRQDELDDRRDVAERRVLWDTFEKDVIRWRRTILAVSGCESAVLYDVVKDEHDFHCSCISKAC